MNSSVEYKFGISPVFNKLLTSSNINGFLIWESANTKQASLLSAPVKSINFYISSFHWSLEYALLTSIYINSYSLIWQANLVNDYLPDPPNPISSMWPYDIVITLSILNMWFIAYSNSAKFIGFLVFEFKSSK